MKSNNEIDIPTAIDAPLNPGARGGTLRGLFEPVIRVGERVCLDAVGRDLRFGLCCPREAGGEEGCQARGEADFVCGGVLQGVSFANCDEVLGREVVLLVLIC